MVYEEMINALKKPGQEILDSWNATDASISHMLVGIYDEYIEVQDALEAYAVSPNEDTRAHVIEELGDLTFYVIGVAQDCDIVLTDTKLPSDQIPPLRKVVMETTTALKRYLYYRKPLDKAEVAIQLLKVLVHVGIEAKKLSSSLDAVTQANMKKLGQRYEDFKYSDEAANSRQDKE